MEIAALKVINLLAEPYHFGKYSASSTTCFNVSFSPETILMYIWSLKYI